VLSDAILDMAFNPVRNRIRLTTERAFQFATTTLPRGGMVNGQIAVAFNTLAPNVVPALRTLESRVFADLSNDLRAMVRGAVKAGLEAGQSSSTIARTIRASIGLGPSQEREVANFKSALLQQDGRSPFDYESRNRRWDPMLKKLYADGKVPTPEQVEKMVTAYRNKRIAINADTVARTATTDAFKSGQRLAWQDAIAKGIVDGDRLRRQWIGVADTRERDSHRIMNNETQPFNAPYSNGQMVPGEGEYNCRCIEKYFLARAA
jgi:hypothetical protein